MADGILRHLLNRAFITLAGVIPLSLKNDSFIIVTLANAGVQGHKTKAWVFVALDSRFRGNDETESVMPMGQSFRSLVSRLADRLGCSAPIVTEAGRLDETQQETQVLERGFDGAGRGPWHAKLPGQAVGMVFDYLDIKDEETTRGQYPVNAPEQPAKLDHIQVR